MKNKITLISIAILCLLSKVKGQTQQADCNNLYLDTDTFHISYQLDTIVEGNLIYLDTTFSVYPFLHLILADTSIITSADMLVLSFLQNPSLTSAPFYFGIKFKTAFFPNNTIVNGLFHIYDSDAPGDSVVNCYFPITIRLQNATNTTDVIKNNAFSVFPNPFSNYTTLHTNHLLKDATLRVYNTCGQEVKEIRNISGQSVTLNREYLTSGVYYVRLTENNITLKVDKLVITD